MSKKDILVLNDYAKFTRSTRTLKSGRQSKAKYAIEIEAQPVLFDMQDSKLMREIAERLEQNLSRKLEQGGGSISKDSADIRRYKEDAYSGGKRYAVKRYSGGKLGATPPSAGERSMFKHSGRLARSIKARYVKRTGQWVINVAANRLRRETFGTQAQYDNFIKKLLGFVPNLDARRYVKSSEYHRNLDAWVDRSVQVLKRNKELKAARRKAIAGALRGLGKLVL